MYMFMGIYMVLVVMMMVIYKITDNSKEGKKKKDVGPDEEAYEYENEIYDLCTKHRIGIQEFKKLKVQSYKKLQDEDFEREIEREINVKVGCDVGITQKWLRTDEGFEECRMVLADYNISLLTVRNTLQEREELLTEIPKEVKDEVVKVLRIFYNDIGKIKDQWEHRKEQDRRAVIDSLTNRVKEEAEFIQDRQGMKL